MIKVNNKSPERRQCFFFSASSIEFEQMLAGKLFLNFADYFP